MRGPSSDSRGRVHRPAPPRRSHRTIPCLLAVVLATALGSASADFAAGLEAHREGRYADAVDHWSRCAEQGDARAQYGLGVIYNEGRGTEVDYARAARWFSRAARQDLAEAQMELGFMRASGRDGVAQDAVQAYVWFLLAAENGAAEASDPLELLESRLTPEERAEANRRIGEWHLGTPPAD